MASGSVIIAGACGYGVWPANTVEAAVRCLQTPVDGIEVDVHLSRDGHVVACHDYRVDADVARDASGRWIDPPGPLIRSLTLDEIRRFDVGRLRPGSAELERHPASQSIDGARIPTLRDLIGVLAAAADRAREIYVEIKTNPQDAEVSSNPVALTGAVMALLTEMNQVDRTTIIAFDWSVLRWLSNRYPGIRTAHLSIPRQLEGAIKLNERGDSPWADGFDAHRYGGSQPRAIAAHGGKAWSVYFRDITPEALREARDLGLSVAVWGVVERSDIDAMLAMGIDSVTVSGPDWGQARDAVSC